LKKIKIGHRTIRVRTIVGENVLQHELLGEAQAAAGCRVVGVRDAAIPERRRELRFSPDDLRPQPLELLGRGVLAVGVGLILDVGVAATEHEIIEQDAIGTFFFCCCRTRRCSATTRGGASRNGLRALHEKRHGKWAIQADGIFNRVLNW
jgi:hypothetical protein